LERSEEANLRNVQNVARVDAWEIRQEGGYVGDGSVRRNSDDDYDGLYGLGAASACHAGWRTGAIVTAGELIASARLVEMRLETPDALSVSRPTTIARTSRGTKFILASRLERLRLSGRAGRPVRQTGAMADLPIMSTLTPVVLKARRDGGHSNLLKRAQSTRASTLPPSAGRDH
jgi:hypothetical protein